MSWYAVDDTPGPPRPSLALRAVIAAAVLAVLVTVYVWFMTMPVKVDGRTTQVSWSTSVRALLADGVVTTPPGDLLSAKDGMVVRLGAGRPPRVYLDGRLASLDDTVRPGMVVTSRPGLDVVESVVEKDEPLEAPVLSSGRGPIVKVVAKGSPGLKRVTYGAVSGALVTETVVAEPAAMVMERVWPSTTDKVVALTFDDGPWPVYTRQILDVLAAERVPATFFMVGKHVDRYPALARMVSREGHLIANHTNGHRVLTNVPWEASRQEIAAAETSIMRATGQHTRWFRPPGGGVSPTVYDVADKLDMRLALWNVDPQDWRRPYTSAIVQRVLASVTPGSVVLLHDGGGDRANTVYALGPIIRALRKQGYTFVTLDGLPGARTGPLEVKR